MGHRASTISSTSSSDECWITLASRTPSPVDGIPSNPDSLDRRRSPPIANGDVRHKPFERSPHAGRPSTTGCRRWTNQPIGPRLSHVQDVLEVGNELGSPNLADGDS